mgnify:CR=1 FL=1
MNENDFITLMVQETLNQHNDDNTVHSLEAFEDRDKACIVIVNQSGEVLEVPKNWGPFKAMMGNHVYINQENDNYELLSILESFLGQRYESIRIVLGQTTHSQSQRKSA